MKVAQMSLCYVRLNIKTAVWAYTQPLELTSLYIHIRLIRCFLRGPCQGIINGTSLEFSWVARRWPSGNVITGEAEESPLLEAVTSKRLMKTNRQRTLVCVLWWFQNVEISDGAIIKCSHKLCVKVVNKSNLQSKPRLQSLIHVTISIVAEVWRYNV
jgi:hypothetical protein